MSLPEHNSGMQRFSKSRLFVVALLLVLQVACGSVPVGRERILSLERAVPESAERQQKGNDVVLFALGLIGTGYRYGGKNPSAGLDCSGMVQHIFEQALGIKVSGSAADIARRGREIERAQLRPGDLVFFNTRNRSFSHVGIYIGDGRFVHAPSENGRVRTESLSSTYFSTRFEAARSLLD